MVGDSLTTDTNGIRVDSGPKIRRIRGSIVGCAGGVPEGQAFFHWYEGGAKIGEDPELDDNFAALILSSAGMFVVFSNCYPIPIRASVAVIGSGHEIARGAYAAGATLKRAVEIACELDTGSGPPVVVERL